MKHDREEGGEDSSSKHQKVEAKANFAPRWVADAIFYQIFPDRFAKGTANNTHSSYMHALNFEKWEEPPTTYGFKGGNLAGIVEKMMYLAEMGVTAIYFTPVFQSASNHRYHTHDYYRIDPIFGDNEEFKKFIDLAHSVGMKVVLDGVFNHASRGFFQFNHILETGEKSPFIDWFQVTKFPTNAYDHQQPPDYASWWNLHALPQFKHSNKDVQEFIFDVATYWIKQGVDGWRLDVPEEVKAPGFWEEFRRRVKAINPDAYIVGEIWTQPRDWIQGDKFDAVMNYMFTKACIGFFIGNKGDTELIQQTYKQDTPTPIDSTAFATALDALLVQSRLPSTTTASSTTTTTTTTTVTNTNNTGVDGSLAQLNLLDSHDTPRFYTLANNRKECLLMAFLFSMIYPGAPCIYYGDEVGMSGGKDPDCRRSFNWDETSWNLPILNWYKKCIDMRAKYEVLRRAINFQTLLTPAPSVYICCRQNDNGEETIIACFNVGTEDWSGDIPLSPSTVTSNTNNNAISIFQDVWPLSGANCGVGSISQYPIVNGPNRISSVTVKACGVRVLYKGCQL